MRNHRRLALLVAAFSFPLGAATLIIPWLIALQVLPIARERRVRWLRTPIDLPLAAFLGLALVAGLQSSMTTIALASWGLAVLAFGVVLQIALYTLQETPKIVRPLHQAIALGTLIAAVAGLLAIATGHADRAQLPHIGPNALGFGLVAGVLLALPLLRSPGLWSWIAALTLVIGIAVAVATFSREAVYGLVAGGICYAWLERRHLSLRVAARIAACAALGLLVAFATPLTMNLLAFQLSTNSSFHRAVPGVATIGKTLAFIVTKQGYGDRLFIWKGALAMIHDRPWFGVGLGVFPFVVFQWDNQLPPGMPPHSLYLGLAAEIGVPGALAFVAMVVTALWSALRRQGLYRNAATSAFVGMLVGEVRDNITFGFHMAMGFIIVLALLLTSAAPILGDPADLVAVPRPPRNAS